MSRQHAPRRNARILLTATAVTFAVVLAGCAGEAADSGPVTISIAVETQTGATPYTAIIDEFNATNEDEITVELVEIPNETWNQTLKTMFQAGNAPDVVYGSPGTGNTNSLGLYSQAGQVIDLSDEEWATSVIPESAENIYYVDGKLIGVPIDIVPIPMVVNATAYEALGLPHATTFAEFLDQCQEVRDAGLLSLVGLPGSNTNGTSLMALEIAAGRVYAQDPDWNQKRAEGSVTFADSEGWQDTLQAILDMNEAQCFQDGALGADSNQTTKEITSGNLLGVFAPGWVAAALSGINPEQQMSVAVFPGDKAADSFLFASPSDALGINSASKNIEAAKKFLEFWVQPEQLRTFAEVGGNVSLTSVLSGDATSEQFAPIEEFLTDPSKNAPLANLFWPNGAVMDELGAGVQGLLLGEATIDQVLVAMDTAWEG